MIKIQLKLCYSHIFHKTYPIAATVLVLFIASIKVTTWLIFSQHMTRGLVDEDIKCEIIF